MLLPKLSAFLTWLGTYLPITVNISIHTSAAKLSLSSHAIGSRERVAELDELRQQIRGQLDEAKEAYQAKLRGDA